MMTMKISDRVKSATDLQQLAARLEKAANSAFCPDVANEQRKMAMLHQAAADALMTIVPTYPIVAGEMYPSESERADDDGGWRLRNTLADPDAPALAASLERTDLLQKSEILALGIDTAQSIEGATSIEKMLAHQMALAHKLAFHFANKALERRDTVEVSRLINASARMMAACQAGAMTIQRLRTGGKQTVVVQHQNFNVNTEQAVVAGTVTTGGSTAGSTAGPAKGGGKQ